MYAGLILLLLIADVTFTTPSQVGAALNQREIRAAIWLTLVTCTIAAAASVVVATPLAYGLSRCEFRGKVLVDALVDLPNVLPPLVLGLSLLILFHHRWGTAAESTVEAFLRSTAGFAVTYAVPGVILAQFTVAGALATRTLRLTFDQIPRRTEAVAKTLGCTSNQAFWLVVLPQARSGLMTAFTMAWARSLGEFGPILVFAGTTRMKTEVLSTSVFLELSVGRTESAVAVALLMVVMAVLVLITLRSIGPSRSH